MARHRLVNCEFLNAGSFKVNISNKAKLLYFMMITNADDRGFVDSTQDLINSLAQNDKEFDPSISLDLIGNTYNTALNELLDKGYVYEFVDNHSNKVHLIRHWFFHNKLIKGLWTNYRNFLSQVYLKENEYLIGKEPLKENKIKEDKTNQDKEYKELEEIKEEPKKEKEEPKTLKELFGKDSYNDLTPEEKVKWSEYIDSIDISKDSMPF